MCGRVWGMRREKVLCKAKSLPFPLHQLDGQSGLRLRYCQVAMSQRHTPKPAPPFAIPAPCLNNPYTLPLHPPSLMASLSSVSAAAKSPCSSSAHALLKPSSKLCLLVTCIKARGKVTTDPKALWQALLAGHLHQSKGESDNRS